MEIGNIGDWMYAEPSLTQIVDCRYSLDIIAINIYNHPLSTCLKIISSADHPNSPHSPSLVRV
jgi:hypothetical protein